MQLNEAATKLIKRLEEKNFEVYVVGGVIRNEIIGIEYEDIDISTTATFSDLENVFSDCKIKHYKKGKTLGIIFDHTYFEVSTFVGNSIEEDLYYRDFTMNSIAYNPSIGWIDPYHGKEAIDEKIITTCRNPKIVFEEDPIRILRAIRFSATLGFTISNEVQKALFENAFLLKKISLQRIRHEFEQILLIEKPSFVLRKYFPIFSIIFPDLKPTYQFHQHSHWHHLDVFEHILSVIDTVPANLLLRLTAFFHDIGKPSCFTMDENGIGHFHNHYQISTEIAQTQLQQLKYNKEQIQQITKLVFYHDLNLPLDKKTLLKFLNKFGKEDIDLLFEIKRADALSQHPDMLPGRIEGLNEVESYIYQLIEEGEPFTIAQLKIKGRSLVKIGYCQEEIKEMLNTLLELVIEGKLNNTFKDLLKYAKEHKQSLA